MLLTLRLRDFVIVDSIELHFATGFSVLTGETGAGKSILIDALGLLLGDRADAGVVRHGAEKAELAAEFGIAEDDALHALLAEAGLEGDADLCLLRRTIDAGGRSRAWVNGHAATTAQLKQIGEYLVDIHGQHAHQRLVRPDAQRELLDAYCGASQLTRAMRQAWQAWKHALEAVAAARANAESMASERERLLWQIGEVRALSPQLGEWEALQQEHARLSHAQSLLAGTQSSLDALIDGEENLSGRLGTVLATITDLLAHDPQLGEIHDYLQAVDANLDEAIHALRRYAGRVELDPERLSELDRRMDDLYRMARKYRLKVEELPESLESWQHQLEALDRGADLDALEHAVVLAKQQWLDIAKRVSALRHAGAHQLSTLVSTEMQQMAMAGSRFETTLLLQDEPTQHGLEAIEFRVAPHAAAEARSLAKVASGGELSRISLALQVVASQSAHVPTLVFDEVDVGIGGRVAETVGQLLARLGARHQVLCITHLPQVAACATHQFQVRKQMNEQGVSSHIDALNQQARIEEIARMLGGSEITHTVRQHAAEMLAPVLGER
ncbi:DNA repair protein RecN [Burkholderiaceae bacterium DAT-1]|nr:DNA repair protein RecN [Burkholderiaceae bacterium DAT-1]